MTGDRPSAGTNSLDPDVLAELELERDFLLRSLDDLDAEHGAGDLAAHDHEALADDYTRRLAEVVRAIDEQRDAFADLDVRLSSRQRILTIVAVCVVAIVAGVLLSRASGFRTPDASSSGDIRRSSAGLLAEADTLTREGRWPEAIEVYDEVLDLAPANVEALTYRGWLTARLGDPGAGLADLTEALAVDQEFADARVFSAILLEDAQRYDEAAEQLRALDALDAPPEILGLVDGSDLRVSVAAGQLAQRFGGSTNTESVDLAQITGTLDEIARAANVLVEVDPVLAVKTFSAVIEADPDQVVALVGKGRIYGADPGIVTAAPDRAAEGLALLDRAVELEPGSDLVRLFRAEARAVQGDPAGARADLDGIDRAGLPEPFDQLFDQIAAAVG